MTDREPTQLEVIKQGLTTPGVIALFADNLPTEIGKHAKHAAERFSRMLYTAISQSAALQKCTMASLVKAGSIAASLDLDIDPRGLAYLVPYGRVAQLQIGYSGLIELAYRSGKVKAISAHCIYESEKKSVTIERIDGRFRINHPFSFEMPTGEMIAVYAAAEIEGLGPQFCVMRKDEVEKIRKISKASNSPAWKDFYEQMAKKTAIRQLSKFLPKSILPAFSRAAAIDEEQTFAQTRQVNDAKITAETGSELVDVEFEPEVLDEREGPGGDNSRPEFLDDEAGKEEARAKAKEEKRKLAEAANIQGFACNNTNCRDKGVVFTDPKMIKKGRTTAPQCPTCLGSNIVEIDGRRE